MCTWGETILEKGRPSKFSTWWPLMRDVLPRIIQILMIMMIIIIIIIIIIMTILVIIIIIII